MTLHDEIDRNTGSIEVPHRENTAGAIVMRLLLLVACAVLTTLALGGAILSRTPDSIVGSFVVNLLLITMMVMSLRMFRPTIHDSGRALALLGGLVALQVVLAFAAANVHADSPELVPIAFAGVVISTLFDRRVSLLTVVLLAVLIASQPSYHSASALPILIASGASAITALAVILSLR